ncbi:hypothetical protein C0991_012519 [Blastosporella zonata]|nr:hypothetical protein C0991_012519 [Blastosporella zonata]
MEDPWANAWGESQKPNQTWSHSTQDPETEIAIPSWGTGAAVNWAEPSLNQETLWHPSEPAKDQWASTYDDLPLGKPDTVTVLDVPTSPQVPDTAVSSPVSPPASPEPTSETEEPEIRSSSPAPRPTSPDAFGTFETALEDNDPWAAGSVASPDTAEPEDVWVPSWGAPDSATEIKEAPGPVDEWEEAKRQKARQDQHVPPEVLASILEEFHKLSDDMWSAQSPAAKDLADARSGMEGVEGLNSIANRHIPHDLTLPAYMQFSKTFTAKRMADSLRLSRHVPITRLSPFTMYMASKGSTAWESSVKSRIEVSNDDLLPPGWRVVDKDKEEPIPAVDTKKKATGGLLSFFGRKTSNAASETNPQRSESPVRTPSISTSVLPPNAVVPSPVAPQSTRPSLDGTKTPIRPSTPVLSGSSPTIASPAAPTPAPSSQTPAVDMSEQTQALSAVSRFLTRFSRNKTAVPGSKEALALSTDDLEFLSDIVPSADDDADEADQLQGLSNMLSSSPLATTLPPLLPAPPRRPPSTTVSETFAALPPTLPQDDLFSIFETLPSTRKPTMSTAQIPISLIPQLASTSTPPTFPQTTNSFYRTESQGPSSRGIGLTSPFETLVSTSRSHTPQSVRRTPIAIMSSGSSSTSGSGSSVILPPPPILPLPPLSRPTSTPSHSRAPSQHKTLEDDDFAAFHSPPVPQPSLLAYSSASSIFSDQGLSSSHTKPTSDFFDDFDDFVSSPIHDPSPPRPPAKPSLLGQKPIAPVALAAADALPQLTLPHPPVEHPSPPPRQGSRAAEHQRTSSLMNIAAVGPGKWPGPPTPLTDPLPPPDAPQTTSTSTIGSSSTHLQSQHRRNGSGTKPSTSSQPGFPFFPPPPGIPGLRTTMSMSPSPPPPQLWTAPSAPANRTLQNGRVASPAPQVPKYTPSSTPAASGGLSAQDLSFFEGL